MLRHIPLWVFDWSGSVIASIALFALWYKRSSYWNWSNASLIPYTALFADTRQWMLLGLQGCFLMFGIHGLYLWHLEKRRDNAGAGFNETVWYSVTWVLTLGIFTFSVYVTDFSQGWNWVQFVAVAITLIANFALTRKWIWNWPVWLVVNAIQVVYFLHLNLWGQFCLQFVLAGLSVQGWRIWAGHISGRRALALRSVGVGV